MKLISYLCLTPSICFKKIIFNPFVITVIITLRINQLLMVVYVVAVLICVNLQSNRKSYCLLTLQLLWYHFPYNIDLGIMSKKIYCKGSVVVLLFLLWHHIDARNFCQSCAGECWTPDYQALNVKMAKYELFDAWVSITTVLNFAKILTFWVLVSIAVGWNPASMWLVCSFFEVEGSGGNVWKFTQWCQTPRI